jgi:hypothetical protein
MMSAYKCNDHLSFQEHLDDILSLHCAVRRCDGENTMTPSHKRQKVVGGDKNDRTHDDDVNLDDKLERTNHTTEPPRSGSNDSSHYHVQHGESIRLRRADLGPLDVILGRSCDKKGVYLATLQASWQHYEDATHSGKRLVCRAVIRELYQKNVRFLNKIEDGTRHGYYTIEPQASAKVERKVIRGLRQEVLHFTIDRANLPPHTIEARQDNPLIKHAMVKPQMTKGSVRKKNSKKTETCATKKSKTQSIDRGQKEKQSKVKPQPKKVKPQPKKVKPQPKETKPQRIKSLGNLDFNQYLPILPAPPRDGQNPQVIVPPSPPPPPPPVLRTHSSLGSIRGNHGQQVQLIPSAMNWGTSDLAGTAPNNVLYVQQQPLVASSPDTVLTPEFFLEHHGNKRVSIKLSHSLESTPQVPSKMRVRSSVSYDLTKVFDDNIDAAEGEIEDKACPPLLTGRQSSVFSMVQFADWNHHQNNNEDFVLQPRRFSLIDDDPTPAAVIPYSHKMTAASSYSYSSNNHLSVSAPRMTDNFDRNNLFDEANTLSPTPIRYNNDTSEHFLSLVMPHITPHDDRYQNTEAFGRTHRNVKTAPHDAYAIPTRSGTKRAISDIFDENDAEEYHTLCNQLEISMAKLESEEQEHKSWEAHNEALWCNFIQEQPDMARMLNTRTRTDKSDHHPAVTASDLVDGVQVPDYESVNETNHDTDTWKWQQLFASDIEENWEEV